VRTRNYLDCREDNMTAAPRLEALCRTFNLPADATESDLELRIDQMCGLRPSTRRTILPPSHKAPAVVVPAHVLSDAIATTGRDTVRPGSR
jgi:hypothetical protein